MVPGTEWIAGVPLAVEWMAGISLLIWGLSCLLRAEAWNQWLEEPYVRLCGLAFVTIAILMIGMVYGNQGVIS